MLFAAWTALDPASLTAYVLLLLTPLALLVLLFRRRALPPVACSFREVLADYKPGRILDLHDEYARKAGALCWTIKVPGDPRIFGTIDPAVVDHVLISQFAKYEKGPQWRTAFKDLLGSGIFNADGETWRRQRKVASHEFSIRSLRTFMRGVFEGSAASVMTAVAAAAETRTTLDVQQLFARYTLDSIGEIGFGVKIGCLANESVATAFSDAFDTATRLSGGRFVDPLWPIKRLLGIGTERSLAAALRKVHAFTDGVIGERRGVASEELGERGDLLSRFMAQGFTDGELRDAIINFVLAGRDTTAIMLTWAIYELAQHPEVVEQLRTEAAAISRDEISPGGPDALTKALLSPTGGDAAYLKATLTEVLRLHPSVPLDFKTAVTDDVLPDGTRIRRGERVMFVAYSMGRSQSLWPEPDRFDPSRFLLPDGGFKFPPASRLPVFLAGPRTCLGKDMAFLGAGLLLTTLLSRFDFELVERPDQVTYDVGLTLWTSTGVRVRFRERGA